MTSRPLRVLVVDDSDTIRSLIALNLELEGCEVHEALDGQQCLDLVRTIQPDVITLDVAMPTLDGLATATRLRASAATAHIPIVMVSALAQAGDVARADEIGVEAYLTKPFEPDELVQVVRSVAAGKAPGQPG